MAADWALAALGLAICFAAIGQPVGLAVVLIGLTLGVAAGMASMLPGGLGLQEATMTGVYAMLGVPVEHALVAATLFRVVYCACPFAVSLLAYWLLVGRRDRNPGAADRALGLASRSDSR